MRVIRCSERAILTKYANQILSDSNKNNLLFGSLEFSVYLCIINKADNVMIKFHDVKTTDRELIQSYTLCGDRMNCDLSFANIISWRFLYNTKIAEVDGF